METVDVDASTGKMTVRGQKDPGDKNDRPNAFRGGPTPTSGPSDTSTEIILVNRTTQPVQTFWIDSGGKRNPYHKLTAGETYRQHTYAGHVWTAIGDDGTHYGSVIAESPASTATIEKSFPLPEPSLTREPDRPGWPFQIRVRERKFQYKTDRDVSESTEPEAADANRSVWNNVSIRESEFEPESVLVMPQISPDGKVASVWIQTPGDDSKVFTIESSPKEGGRAKLASRRYRLPGDPMEHYQLVLIDTNTWTASYPSLPTIDFRRPRVHWRNGHQLLVEKVDRGHQRFRLFAVDPLATDSNSVKTVIDEQTDTFIWTTHGPSLPLVTYLSSDDRVIYSSERSGYRHLYSVQLDGDGSMRPITDGDFLVRRIIHFDQENGYADLVVGEYHDDQDPYHRHLIRVSVDDGSVVELTDGDGDHEFEFSPDRRYVIVNHSRVDSPPVHELRRCHDGQLLAMLANAKRIGIDGALPQLPVRFSAKGRDGKTDIWGLICFPKNPSDQNSHPVLENIYAGPHDSHVPKRYRHSGLMSDMTDLGFVVVRIDGMGTANRSKAFHDVAWKNLKDAGFPDRIAWMKAAAQKYPIMDLSRVGVYGTSAGGQNACGALLFHGDFYKAAVASCGCHDNRMDKASWNEQWMGSLVGPHYAESSNIDQAHRLNGDLLLIVGELDTNVPPESTLRLVDALIKADKRFQFLMIPGMGHSDGGKYGRQLTREFFIDKLRPH